MSSTAIRAGKAYVEISTKQDLLDRGLAAVQGKLTAFSSNVAAISRSIGGGITAIGDGMGKFGRQAIGVGSAVAGIGVAGVTALGFMAQSFADAGSAIDDMAQRTGMSAESIGRLSYAAKMSGTDITAVEKSIRTMGKILSEAQGGNQAAASSFSRLGLSVARLSTMAPEKQFATISDAIKGIQDPGARAAMAMDIFGKSGADLVPMLSQGSKGIADLMNEADALGVVMSGKDVAAAAEFGDKLDQFWAIVESLKNAIGAALVPVMSELASTMLSGLSVAQKMIKDFSPFIPLAFKIAAGIAMAGVAVVTLGTVMVGLGAAISGAMVVAGAIGAAIAAIASPIGIAVAALAGFGVALLYYTDAGSSALAYLQSSWAQFSSWVAPIIEGVKNSLIAGEWSTAGEILMLGLEIAFREGVKNLYGIWKDLQTSILNAWTDLPVGIVGGLELMNGQLQNIWDAMVVNLKNAFSTVITWLRGAWDKTVNAIAKRLLYVYSMFDRSIDYEKTAIQMDKEANQRATDRQKELDQTTGGRQKALDETMRSRLTAINDRQTERTAGADAIKNQRTAAAEADKGAFQQTTNGLQSRLNALVQSVPKPSQGSASTLDFLKMTPLGGLLTNLGGMAMNVMKSMPNLAEQPKTATSIGPGGTAGTFSGFAAGLIASSSPLVSLVDTSKKQLTTLGKIEQNTAGVKDGALVYGE